MPVYVGYLQVQALEERRFGSGILVYYFLI